MCSYEKEPEYYMADCSLTTVNMQMETQILDLETPRTINTFLLTEGFSLDECGARGIKKSEAIYIPTQFKGTGCEIGSDFAITCKGSEFHFILAGYYDSAVFATTNAGNVIFYVPDECFESLKGELEEAFLLKATVRGGYESSKEFIADFKDSTGFAPS